MLKGVLIYSKWLVPPSAAGWAIFPFIIFKRKEYATEEKINHERIHLAQQLELLILPFYVFYVLNFIVNLLMMNRKPYRNIIFEKEAYDNERDLRYLEDRKFWAFLKYFGR